MADTLLTPPFVRGHDHAVGDAGPALVLFGDYTDPDSAAAHQGVLALRERWDGFTYAWRHLPSSTVANGAALFAEGAAAQDAFWAYHHILLARQDSLSVPDLMSYAGQIGLDLAMLDRRHRAGARRAAHPRRHRRRQALRDAGDALAVRRERALGGRLGAGRAGGRAACSPGRVRSSRSARGRSRSRFAALLNRHAAWRHRRVETITVLSHEQVRRHVSVDFTVPLEHREEVRLSEHEWIVPLALLAKRPLVHFDLRSEDETAVPLLRSDEARLIARELLYLALDVDAENADARRRDAADRVDPGRQARRGGADRRRAGGARGPARAAARVHRARGPSDERVPALRGTRTTSTAGA